MAVLVVPTININDGRVDLRELFEKLELNGRFRDYVKAYLFKYGFEEGYDYFPYTTIVGATNQTQKEYMVTLDCAKELCMLAKNDKGRLFRKYFIATEKALQITNPDIIKAVKNCTSLEPAKNFASLNPREVDNYVNALLEKLQATEKALQEKVKYIEQITTVECRTVCLSDICAKFKDCYPVDVLLLLFEKGILVRRCSGNYPSPYYEEGNDLIPCKGSDGRPYTRYTPRGEMIISELLLDHGYKLK